MVIDLRIACSLHRQNKNVHKNLKNTLDSLLPLYTDTNLVAKGKQLKLARAQDKDSGLYECVAKNGVDENLHKVVQVKVRGK